MFSFHLVLVHAMFKLFMASCSKTWKLANKFFSCVTISFEVKDDPQRWFILPKNLYTYTYIYISVAALVGNLI